MTTSPESARVGHAVARLRSAGERVTPARYAVLRVVDAADRSDEHLTAEEIGVRVAGLEPAVHRATVYRTLTSLTDIGVLAHVHLGGSATVYHLAEGPRRSSAQDHAHTTRTSSATCAGGCSTCRRTSSTGWPTRLRADLGFVLDTGHAALLGTCRDCTAG